MARKSSKYADARRKKTPQEEYDYHNPVLLNEILHYMITNPSGIYIDGTLGGGGHSSEILKRLGIGGWLISFDKDPEAIEHSAARFAEELSKPQPRIRLRNECFSMAFGIEEIQGKVSGFLLDLGVSSHQLDGSGRGISYRFDSPLDMRFGTEGTTAKDIVHAASEEELNALLTSYGEEPFAKAIARRLVLRRRAGALDTTGDLRKAVEEAVPPQMLFSSLSRVFQAIRIAVNDELDVLHKTLTNIVPLLEIGGRILVISYHSLEDRIVKDTFKQLTRSEKTNKYKEEARSAQMRLVTGKPLLPSTQEIERNVRARSAKLRIAERIA